MTQQTAAEKAVQSALYDLWYTHYTNDSLTTPQRNQLVEDFAAQWLDSSKIKLDKPAYWHPMTRVKRRYSEPPVDAMSILADFILRADMHAERGAEYSLTHAEQDLTNADKRKEKEVGIFSDELNEEAGERVPYGYMDEAQVIAQLYTPKEPPTVEEFRKELARVKEYAEFYATTLAEEYGYNKADAFKRIRALRLERVKECRICGGAFYPRNIRRETCDQQYGIKVDGKRSTESACEIIESQTYSREYYEKSVKWV